MIAAYSPSQWQELRMALSRVDPTPAPEAPAVDELCVNEGGEREDGSFCRDRAGPTGWCPRCWKELAP